MVLRFSPSLCLAVVFALAICASTTQAQLISASDALSNNSAVSQGAGTGLTGATAGGGTGGTTSNTGGLVNQLLSGGFANTLGISSAINNGLSGLAGGQGGQGGRGGGLGGRGMGNQSRNNQNRGGGNQGQSRRPSIRRTLKISFAAPIVPRTVVQSNMSKGFTEEALQGLGRNIRVSTAAGKTERGTVAVLSGTVATEYDRKVAEMLAMLEPSVTEVKNQLVVRPRPMSVPGSQR